jgi:tetratricopeptide (TPR) repeat protein
MTEFTAVGSELVDRFTIVSSIPTPDSLSPRWRAADKVAGGEVLITPLAISIDPADVSTLKTLSARLQKLSHPHIRRHIGLWEYNTTLFIVDELSIQLGIDLDAALLSDEDLQSILTALEYAETLGFTHSSFDIPWFSSRAERPFLIQYLGWPLWSLTGKRTSPAGPAAQRFAHWLLKQTGSESFSTAGALALQPGLTDVARTIIAAGQREQAHRFSDLTQQLIYEGLAATITTSSNRLKPTPYAMATTPHRNATILAPSELDSKVSGFNPNHLLIGMALLIIAGFVFFVLPGLIGPNDRAPATATPRPATEASLLPVPGPAPIAQARDKIAREQVTALAEQFLRQLISLEDLGIGLWNAKKLAELNARAIEADESFRQSNNLQAVENYRALLKTVTELNNQLPELQETYLAAAQAALAQYEPTLALTNWEISARLNPNDQQIQSTWLKVKNIPAIQALIAEAALAKEKGELVTAKTILRKAVTLFEDWEPSQNALIAVNDAIAKEGYQNAMTAGFNQLAAGRYLEAEQAFQRALNLTKDNSEANDGLIQVQQARLNASIESQLQRAREAAIAGQWLDAKTAFEQILQTAPGINSIQSEIEQMNLRIAHQTALNNFLADPARLQSDTQFKSAQALAIEISQLAPPFGSLRALLPKLTRLITNARRPVVLTINSDEKTQITVLRRGEDGQLGTLRQRALTLIPGRYTLTGSRIGYRDVRQDITLDGEDRGTTITIICEEKI